MHRAEFVVWMSLWRVDADTWFDLLSVLYMDGSGLIFGGLHNLPPCPRRDFSRGLCRTASATLAPRIRVAKSTKLRGRDARIADSRSA